MHGPYLPRSRLRVGLVVLGMWMVTSVAASAVAQAATIGDPGTSLPGGQRLPSGAVVTTSVRFQGNWLAAGDDIPAGAAPALTACEPNGCNPMVWTSSNGKQWTARWGAPPTGSIPGELMVSGSGSLLLFDDDEGTRLWVTPNGVNWEEVALPAGMNALGVRDVVYGRGRFVALFNNRFAGGANTSYGSGDEIWTSVDGQHWAEASVPGSELRFDSLTVSPTGFRLGGSDQAESTGVWKSDRGTTWKLLS